MSKWRAVTIEPARKICGYTDHFQQFGNGHGRQRVKGCLDLNATKNRDVMLENVVYIDVTDNICSTNLPGSEIQIHGSEILCVRYTDFYVMVFISKIIVI